MEVLRRMEAEAEEAEKARERQRAIDEENARQRTLAEERARRIRAAEVAAQQTGPSKKRVAEDGAQPAYPCAGCIEIGVECVPPTGARAKSCLRCREKKKPCAPEGAVVTKKARRRRSSEGKTAKGKDKAEGSESESEASETSEDGGSAEALWAINGTLRWAVKAILADNQQTRVLMTRLVESVDDAVAEFRAEMSEGESEESGGAPEEMERDEVVGLVQDARREMDEIHGKDAEVEEEAEESGDESVIDVV